jgi:hypothetical protein
MSMIKTKYSDLLGQDAQTNPELTNQVGEQSNYLSDSSKHQSQFKDCLTFCGSRFKSVNEKGEVRGVTSYGESRYLNYQRNS